MKKFLSFKIIAVILLLIALIFLLLIAYFKIQYKDKVLNNTYLGNLDISHMSYAELKNYLDQLELGSISVSIVNNEETIIQFGPQDIGYKLDSAKTVNNIMRYGTHGNVFISFINVIKSYFKPYYANIECTYSKNRCARGYI